MAELKKADLNLNLVSEARKKEAQNVLFKGKADKAIDEVFVKTSTLVGKVDGEVLGGIKTLGQSASSAEEVITAGIGALTDKMPSLSGIKLPNISQTDSDGIVTDMTSLTGLPAIKCNNPNSGMEAISDGTPQSIAECVALVEGATKKSFEEISAFTSIIEAQNATGLGSSGGLFGKISAALSVLSIGNLLPEIKALAPIRDLNDKIGEFQDKVELGIKDATGELFAGLEGVGDQVVNSTQIVGMVATINKAKSELKSFTDLSDVIPTGLTDKLSVVKDFVDDVDNFVDEFDGRVSEGLGGVLQNLGEGLTGAANNFINNLVPGGVSASETERKAILKQFSLGDDTEKAAAVKTLVTKSNTVSAAMKQVFEDVKPQPTASDLNNAITDEARRRGIPEKEISEASEVLATIDSKMKKLDTTISGTVVVDAGIFDEAIPIDENNQKWSGRNSPEDTFTYVASVEELDAEFATVKREVTEVIVHATETYTNKDIGAIEINNLQIELGHDGIGYHYVIRRDGRLQRARPVSRIGDHAVVNGHDTFSIGIVLVGGLNISAGDDNPTDYKSAQSFTRQQYTTLEKFLRSFYRKYPGGQVFGHNDVDENELDPYFDVSDYVESVFRKENKLIEPSTKGPLSPAEINSDN